VERELVAFNADCTRHPDNVAFVYIAGHGVQLSKHEAIVLLEDVGAAGRASLLYGAIDAVGCHRGMNHARAAKTQFWFVDACRQVPVIARRFETLSGALTLDPAPGHCESSPLFLAASTREAAFAKPGDATLFSQALLWALNGGAAVGPTKACPRWHVPVASLPEGLSEAVAQAAGAAGEEQHIDVTGRVLPAVVHQFQQAPIVPFRVELLPDEAAAVTRATLLRDAVHVVPGLPSNWPLETQLTAGLYLMQLTTRPPFRAEPKIFNVQPPEFADCVEVAP
jgi:hypothetical protein